MWSCAWHPASKANKTTPYFFSLKHMPSEQGSTEWMRFGHSPQCRNQLRRVHWIIAEAKNSTKWSTFGVRILCFKLWSWTFSSSKQNHSNFFPFFADNGTADNLAKASSHNLLNGSWCKITLSPPNSSICSILKPLSMSWGQLNHFEKSTRVSFLKLKGIKSIAAFFPWARCSEDRFCVPLLKSKWNFVSHHVCCRNVVFETAKAVSLKESSNLEGEIISMAGVNRNRH